MNHPIYAFYGHHKCATMSLKTLCGSVCRRLGRSFNSVYNEDQFNRDLVSYCQKKNIEFLAYVNADSQYINDLNPHKGFHIIRDPRDIVVSAYYSHGYSHPTLNWPELEQHRKKLNKMSLNEGLIEEIYFRKRSFEHIYNWNYDNDQILEIRFEDLVKNNYKTILRIFEFLDLLDQDDYKFIKRFAGLGREIRASIKARTNILIPRIVANNKIPSAELLTIAWRNRFEAKSKGRSQGIEDVSNHYRKGKSGDWKTHFTDDHKKIFKELYPDLIPKLGYAENDNW